MTGSSESRNPLSLRHKHVPRATQREMSYFTLAAPRDSGVNPQLHVEFMRSVVARTSSSAYSPNTEQNTERHRPEERCWGLFFPLLYTNGLLRGYSPSSASLRHQTITFRRVLNNEKRWVFLFCCRRTHPSG